MNCKCVNCECKKCGKQNEPWEGTWFCEKCKCCK